MKVGLTGSGVLALAGVAVGGFVLWQAYRKTSAAVDGIAGAWNGAGQWLTDAGRSVSDAATMALANAQQAWGNATGTFVPGDPTRAALYSDQGYAGIDPATGRSVSLGEWYSNPEALTYEWQQRDAGNAPAATSIDGAAFGAYRLSARRPANTQVDTWDAIAARRARETTY